MNQVEWERERQRAHWVVIYTRLCNKLNCRQPQWIYSNMFFMPQLHSAVHFSRCSLRSPFSASFSVHSGHVNYEWFTCLTKCNFACFAWLNFNSFLLFSEQSETFFELSRCGAFNEIFFEAFCRNIKKPSEIFFCRLLLSLVCAELLSLDVRKTLNLSLINYPLSTLGNLWGY